MKGADFEVSHVDGLEVIPTPNVVWGFPAAPLVPSTHSWILAQPVIQPYPHPPSTSYADFLLLLYKHQMLSNLKPCTPVLCGGRPFLPMFPLANPDPAFWPQLRCHLCNEVFHDPPFSALTGTISVLYRAHHTCV